MDIDWSGLSSLFGFQKQKQKQQDEPQPPVKRSPIEKGTSLPGRDAMVGRGAQILRPEPGGETADAFDTTLAGTDPMTALMQYLSQLQGNASSVRPSGQAGADSEDRQAITMSRYADQMMADKDLERQAAELKLSQARNAGMQRQGAAGLNTANMRQPQPQAMTFAPPRFTQPDPYEQLRKDQIQGRQNLMNPNNFIQLLQRLRGF